MLFCNCVCAWQPVRVVHGDGRIRSLTHPITVGELLECHPHHFVCEPSTDGPLYHTGMLPLDMELEEGRIYLLLPLPRLLPHLANTFPKPPSCPCFSQRETRTVAPHSSSSSPASEAPAARETEEEDGDAAAAGIKTFKERSRLRKWVAKNQGQLLAAANSARELQQRARSKLVRSLIHMSKKLLPERLIPRISFEKLESQASMLGRVQCSRNRWRPGLECISEVDLLAGLLRDSAPSGFTDR